jgi:formimidoylglutamate deiminase
MYTAAFRLTPEGLYAASRQAFLEMALAGVTAVGEFHYLHHAPDGAPYSERNLLAQTVIRAARDVGLRIALLRVGYARAGFEQALDPRQRRFVDPGPEQWLEAVETLAREVEGDGAVSVAAAPHSVRALPRAWLEALARCAPGRLHMHVAEQPLEVQACVAEHGQRPLELLHTLGLLGSGFVAVHGIHVTPSEIALLRQSGAAVCACPTTERNLGDGVVPADQLLEAGVSLSLGTDSQASIDLLGEAALVEGHLRLVRGQRNVLDPGKGKPEGLGARLIGMATSGGARALGLPTGELTPGQPADFFTVDLEHPKLMGTAPDAVAGALVALAGGVPVREVAVDGRLLVQDGRHPLAEETGRAFARVVKEVFA